MPNAESGGSLPPMPMFWRWEVPDRPLRIQLRLDLIDRLDCAVRERFNAVTARGSEIGGVLLGRIDKGAANRTITIEECELVPCDYSRSPLYLLADDDRQRLRQAVDHYSTANGGLSVVGFFRSNTRRDLAVDDEDRDILQEYFADPDCVFLLVKPLASKPSIAAFFLWKDGEIHGQSELQFPIERSEFGPARAAERRAPQATPAVPDPSSKTPVKPHEPAPKAEPSAIKAPPRVPTPAPAAAPELVSRSIRILGPEPPALLVDSHVRSERELAAATRTGKLKEYLLHLKRPFCEHPTLLWIENVPASDKTAAHSRSVWQCTECGATIHGETKQPYACEEAEEAGKIPPPAPQEKNLERRRPRR